MLEQILDIRNVQKALRQVVANGGAAGIDGMQVEELRDYLTVHWQSLRTAILEGRYRPQAVRKVEIPWDPKGAPECWASPRSLTGCCSKPSPSG